ncbi:flagellar motor protein MotB [Zhaonella formicivorans]|uniref:flagellar motor protein MotB n=1 Tax=Zhaonella formicivorans TaxID=2528593 RepID=UPI0010D59FA5|nr:flagellar motor protein MotB [Zhaonella formicivorans]
MRRRSQQQGGAPEWMTTFSDLMTLLLTFFVLLYSFSSIDANKFKAFLASFQGAGILSWGDAPLEEISPPTTNEPSNKLKAGTSESLPTSAVEGSPMEVYAMVKNFIEEMGLEGEVQARIDENGVALYIKDRILFDSGKADLKKEAKFILDPIAKLLSTVNEEIWVEGHTDNRPINTREFPTNWELSTARSSRVIRYFVEHKNLNPKKFVAVGYGEYRPLVPNTSPDNMQQNRRVVITIRTKYSAQGEVLPNE